jgi:hypothetical protein
MRNWRVSAASALVLLSLSIAPANARSPKAAIVVVAGRAYAGDADLGFDRGNGLAARQAEFGRVEAIAAGPGGSLWIADNFQPAHLAPILGCASRVIDRRTGRVRSVLGRGSSRHPLYLEYCSGLALLPRNQLMVADFAGGRLLEAATTGSHVRVIARSPPLYYPEDIAVDSSGNIFVPNAGNNRVLEIGPSGRGARPPSQPVPCGQRADQRGGLGDQTYPDRGHVACGDGRGQDKRCRRGRLQGSVRCR